MADTSAPVLVEDHQGKPMTTSLVVAQVFGKAHFNVLQSIEKLVERGGLSFQATSYTDSFNRSQKMYLMDRDAFTLLAMGFTGAAALEWKVKYIEAFNLMEARLNKPMSKLDMMEQTVKYLRDHEEKLEEHDSRLDSHEHDIKALKHKTSTMGCPPNGIPVAEALRKWGRGMNRTV